MDFDFNKNFSSHGEWRWRDSNPRAHDADIRFLHA